MPSAFPFPADMTDRAIRIAQRKKLRRDCTEEIVRDTQEVVRLHDRTAQLYQALGMQQFATREQMQQMSREMAQCLVGFNTKIDGLKLLLAELDKLEASNG